jgi:hypothetical protein
MDEAVEVNLLRFVLHVIVDVGHDPRLPVSSFRPTPMSTLT